MEERTVSKPRSPAPQEFVIPPSTESFRTAGDDAPTGREEGPALDGAKGSLEVTVIPPAHPAFSRTASLRSRTLLDDDRIQLEAPPGFGLLLHPVEAIGDSDPTGAALRPDEATNAETRRRWTGLEPGLYELEAELTGHCGAQSFWLRDLIVEAGHPCRDVRLESWNPFATARVMDVRLEILGERARQHGAEEVEIALALDGEWTVYAMPDIVAEARALDDRPVWSVVGPSRDDAWLVAAASQFGEVAVPFVQGYRELQLLPKVSPRFVWPQTIGGVPADGMVRIERLPLEDPRRPLDMFVDLSATTGLPPGCYVPVPLALGERYRIVDQEDRLAPFEFSLGTELLDQERPTIEVEFDHR